MKISRETAVAAVVLCTGVASITVQLLIIRELLTQFQGNEIVIALILFAWLVLGGIGTRLALFVDRGRPSVNCLAWISLYLALLPSLLIPAMRWGRDVFFTHGVSVGFYPTLVFVAAAAAPYCLVLGFALPYSLYVLRRMTPDYPAVRIYVLDNIGDVTGGALFSFFLVFFLTPLQALLVVNSLLAASAVVLAFKDRRRIGVAAGAAAVLLALVVAVAGEKPSLAPEEGALAAYRESLYGRITILQDQGEFTLFEDGVPLFSSRNQMMAEEIVHYPMAQLASPARVLLISTEGGLMEELRKHRPRAVDYVELNPAVTEVLFQFGLVTPIEGLQVIHRDGRAYLAQTDKTYDAILVNLPEPETFQTNRFFTESFFRLADARLNPGGILSFAVEGYENYLAEPQRRKVSSLYNTAAEVFRNVVLLPGQRIFFLCRQQAVDPDIPALLAARGIQTDYIQGFFYGNLSAARIKDLNDLIIADEPRNTDTDPHLMQIMFQQWFAKFGTSPAGFILVLALLCLVYLVRCSREEYLLFSTGCLTMGSEILVVFAFQIFFGYIYFQIGVIVTVYLAGLLPGALLGRRMKQRRRRLLVTDLLLVGLMAAFMIAVAAVGHRLPLSFFLAFGFAVSLLCGFQFPLALGLQKDRGAAATRFFSADLMGAAAGTLFTSLVLIPYFGLLPAAAVLIVPKIASMIIIGGLRAHSPLFPLQ
ncbi:MAG TPA: hypothetical protein ACFCUC_07525 [Desulfobacterales bacterium]